ncbi:MAG: exo-alpha-sialidase [Sphingobacteriaceae bacterium]|jgi:photosystem II stability/assembly factor-like uncharacterized protein|nr:exo-alpha-sialidase [Sphingobacteriaceae bacterium]
MKRLLVLAPAILLVLFLLNSFVLKENKVWKKTSEVTTISTGVILRYNWWIGPFANVNRSNAGTKNIVFKSADFGKTWQDISEGLPEIDQPVDFFAGETDIYLRMKNGMYRSESNLKTPVWQKELDNVSTKPSTSNIVKSEGVLIATGEKGIKRSTDNGEHWQWVISEGGVGIAVERIDGGFAAISYSTQSKSRRIRISLDSGKTWQAIDQGLNPSLFISSIKQVGKYLVCSHPDGIFRSSDIGKTWEKVHSGADKNEFSYVPAWYSSMNEPKRVFRIYASGDVLYAVAGNSGC